MCGARRLQRRNGTAAARFFLLFVLSFMLLLQITTTDDDEQQLVRVREGSPSPSPSPSPMGGGGGERQELGRLGSRPPCCERKCGGCAPCRAVQVLAGAGAEGARRRPQCANYEPVGWKCRCGAAVFDP
ncbi:hypothetical protein ACP4OV_031424 [Aristida adscensionis]